MNLYRKPVKMRWTAPSRSFQNSAGGWGRFQSSLNRRERSIGPEEMAGKKRRKARYWLAGRATISRSRIPKTTSRLRNVTYEIPRNPGWEPGIARGRNRAATRGSRVKSSAVGKGQYQAVRALSKRKPWATAHSKRPQA